MSYTSLKRPERVVLRAEARLCGLSGGVWGRVRAERAGGMMWLCNESAIGRVRAERAGGGLKWGVLKLGLGPQASGVGRVGCEG